MIGISDMYVGVVFNCESLSGGSMVGEQAFRWAEMFSWMQFSSWWF